MKFILKSSYPCLVKSENFEFEIDETDTLEIRDEEFLFIYPTCGQIPFYVNLKNPTENEFMSIFPQTDSTLIILENPQNLLLTSKKALYFSGKRCDVSANSNQISFESDTTKITYSNRNSGEVQEIFKLKDFACVQFPQDLYAFSTKTNKLTHFKGKISRNGDEFVVTRTYDDSVQRQRNCKFKFENGLHIESEEFVRNNTNSPAELAPYQLLESVLAKDFSHACSFLNDELKSKINPTQISEFFGSFTSILPLSTTEFITISDAHKNYISFQMQNGKISDINIDDLTAKFPAV